LERDEKRVHEVSRGEGERLEVLVVAVLTTQVFRDVTL